MQNTVSFSSSRREPILVAPRKCQGELLFRPGIRNTVILSCPGPAISPTAAVFASRACLMFARIALLSGSLLHDGCPAQEYCALR